MHKIIYRNKYLLGQLVKKDIEQRYKGSILGILWAILIPILMLVIYTFVFSEIFQARWNIDTSNKFEFALVLFCGLSAFNMISEIMNRSTVLIATNTNYVKKVIFPLEILPVVITLSALFNCIISYLILIIANFVLNHQISATLYQVFLAWIPLVLLGLGIGYILSALTVYLKDIVSFVSILVMILMYISPVFFPLDSVPEKFKLVCMVNPMTYIIENLRNVVLYNKNINLQYLFIAIAISGFFLVIGYYLFVRVKEGFADVL